MRCVFYCTSESYDIDSLAQTSSQFGLKPKTYDDVVHVAYAGDVENNKHAFYFSYGCVVLWGFNEEEETALLSDLKAYEIKPYETICRDDCTYSLGESTVVEEENDVIILESQDPLIKLSLSYAFSQSVKLEIFEGTTARSIEKTRYLTQELALHGKTSLSKQQLAKKVGALFAERNLINLYSNILDTPEFFWKRPRYEPYYHLASEYLDIDTRLAILNKRLSIIHELFGVLSNELNHAHSSRLELIIIYLIVIEVLIASTNFFFK